MSLFIPMGAASVMTTDVMSNTALLYRSQLNIHTEQERRCESQTLHINTTCTPIHAHMSKNT